MQWCLPALALVPGLINRPVTWPSNGGFNAISPDSHSGSGDSVWAVMTTSAATKVHETRTTCMRRLTPFVTPKGDIPLFPFVIVQVIAPAQAGSVGPRLRTLCGVAELP
ncbi:hypothetical protein CC79DRAFT_842118 [Sarocladium strictum]